MKGKLQFYIMLIFLLAFIGAQAQYKGGHGRGDHMSGASGQQIHPCANPVNGGEIASNQTICYGTTPTTLTSISEPDGFVGNLEYQWQKSTAGASSGFVDIGGANSISFTETTLLIQTTWYRRLARVDCMDGWDEAAGSNVLQITVRQQFTAGEISFDGEIICYNTTAVEIGSTTPASGGDENITYFWKSSADNFEAPIDGAAAETYTPGTLTQTTTFRRYAKDGTCIADPVESTGEWMVTVHEQLTLSCPEDFDINTDHGVCTASLTFAATAGGTPTPDVTYKVCDLEITSPHNFPTGTTTVVVTAENSCGLLTCSFTVKVTDNQYPTIENLPENIAQTSDEGECGAVVSWTEPTSADNCEGHSIQQIVGDPSGSFFSVGTHTITYEATDASGNKVSDSFAITITDDEAPQITCPPDITISCEDSSLPAAVGTATATDNCDANPEITYSDEITPGACTNTYTIIRTWKATDLYENFSTCTQTITVRDITKPTVKTKTITIELDEDGNAGIAHDAVDNGSTDNCPGTLTFSTDKTEFTCADLGDNQVILTVTDACGNAASATATVKVVDLIKPVAKCKLIEVFLDASGNVSINPADVDDDSADNCGTITMTVTPNQFTCKDVGENEVILTATDGSGNSASCTTTVTVTDNVKPVVKTKNITVTLDNTGNAVITPDQINNGSSDNCGIATMTLSRTNFSCADMGKTITVTLTVFDVNNNSNTSQATVTVNELSVPVTRVNIRAESYTGGQVKFIANPINGGNNPNYQWYKNGTPIDGANDKILITTCKSGDEHWVVMQSSLPCTAPAESNAMCTY